MAENTETKPNFFPEIGKVVDETAKQDVVEQAAPAAADDDQPPVQVIESLCMKCEEQVRDPRSTRRSSNSSDQRVRLGCCSRAYPSSKKSLLCPSDVSTAASKITRSNPQVSSDVSPPCLLP